MDLASTSQNRSPRSPSLAGGDMCTSEHTHAATTAKPEIQSPRRIFLEILEKSLDKPGIHGIIENMGKIARLNSVRNP
jgi:hypothetical protein